MPGLTSRRIALACGAVAVLLTGLGEAEAARQARRHPPKPLVKAASIPHAKKAEPAKPTAPERAVTWTAGEQDSHACSRIRRKLWQDGEGWVVKAVSVCR